MPPNAQQIRENSQYLGPLVASHLLARRQGGYHAVNAYIHQPGCSADAVALDKTTQDLDSLLGAQFIHACIMLARESIVKHKSCAEVFG